MEQESDTRVAIAELRKDVKALFEHIGEENKLADSVQELCASLKVMTNEIGHIRTDQEKLHSDLEEIKEKPAKRWELVVTGVISFAVATVLSFLFRGI